MEGKYICLICNKVFDSIGAAVLHNYGDHTLGIDKNEFERLSKKAIK